MNLNWDDIKEVLSIFAPLVIVFTSYKLVIESKYKRDLTRIDHIKSLIDEQSLINLEYEIYQQRYVPREQFQPFDQIVYEIRTNQDVIRFTGPLANYLTKELNNLTNSYQKLRSYIQVSEWEPHNVKNEDGTISEVWAFNKNAPSFSRKTGYPNDYAVHLDKAAEQAVQMKKAFNRFQLVSELHLFETPIAFFLLKKRFKAFSLA